MEWIESHFGILDGIERLMWGLLLALSYLLQWLS
tara:strand:+ start:304 stop:405 length:102 start_codon:yes stop_codon:yes gene_type:complete